MARPLTGQVVVKDNKGAGRVFAVRIWAYGQRHYLTLGAERDGWTEDRAHRFAVALAEDVKAKRWQPPSCRRAGHLTSAPLPADAAKAYAQIRKAAQEIDRVKEATQSAVVRLAAGQALSALYVAEDAVGRALRAV